MLSTISNGLDINPPKYRYLRVAINITVTPVEITLLRVIFFKIFEIFRDDCRGKLTKA